MEGDSSGGGIYETVRAEVRRAISEIQNDLQIVSHFSCDYDKLSSSCHSAITNKLLVKMPV